MRARRDWITDVGLVMVALAAAVLTFTTLRDLAAACGITGTFVRVPLSYLVPVTVDAAGAVAARVWLKRQAGPGAVRFARALAWCCIAASIVGNAGQHGMAAYAITPPWFVVVAVSAIPPAMLGAVVHLAHLVRRVDEADPETSEAVVSALEQTQTSALPRSVDNSDLVEKVAAYRAEHPKAGRAVVARELNLTAHQARVALAATNGHGRAE